MRSETGYFTEQYPCVTSRIGVMMADKKFPLGQFKEFAEDILAASPEAIELWNSTSKVRSIAAVLATVRTQAGLSQKQVAEKTGWDKAFVSKLESGTSGAPDLSTIARFAEACSVNAEIVFTSLDSKNKETRVSSYSIGRSFSASSPSEGIHGKLPTAKPHMRIMG
jgi:transcriptional regulator with XRE-family HTH domain